MIQPEKIPGIQPGPVTEWLESHIEGVEGPLRFERIKGGHSNLTFKLEDTRGNAWVLRRPPLGTLLATAHDMGREHRIIAALGPTAVPVPPALGLCTDESVNDAPFYIMAWVSGHVLENAATAQALLDTEGRQRLGSDVIQVLSELHTVDVDAVGLGDLGRKENYLARQLKRWTRQWNDSKTRELAVMEEVSSGLAELLPEQIGATIVHGDYRLGNMLATPEGRIAAVLDWELCTLGDPLADVAYVLNNWGRTGRGRADECRRYTAAHRRGRLPFARGLPRAVLRALGPLDGSHALLPRLPTLAFCRDRRRCPRPLPTRQDGRRPRHRSLPRQGRGLRQRRTRSAVRLVGLSPLNSGPRPGRILDQRFQSSCCIARAHSVRWLGACEAGE